MDLNPRTKSRRRRAYHQNEVLYITKAKALYIIITEFQYTLKRDDMQKRAIFSLFLMICTQASCVMICHYSVMDKKSRINMIRLFWWGEVDSNHRSRGRQIYSLFPLAAREPAHKLLSFGAGDWNRTRNLLITNQLLCQLSYTSKVLKLNLVPRGGIEPPTQGFSVPCSTY